MTDLQGWDGGGEGTKGWIHSQVEPAPWCNLCSRAPCGITLKLDFSFAPPPALPHFPHSLAPETSPSIKTQAFKFLSQILPLESPNEDTVLLHLLDPLLGTRHWLSHLQVLSHLIGTITVSLLTLRLREVNERILLVSRASFPGQVGQTPYASFQPAVSVE